MEKVKEIDIFDILLIIAKKKTFIFFVTLVFSISAIVYSILVPEYWYSEIKVSPIEENNNSALGMLSGGIGSLGASLLGGGDNNVAIKYIVTMRSKKFSKMVIEKFELLDYMEIPNKFDIYQKWESATFTLNNDIVSINYDQETNIISIGALTKEKTLSKEIVEFYKLKLDEHYRMYSVSKGRESRKFLEKRITQVRGELDVLADALIEFRKENNIIEMEQQIKSSAELYAKVIENKLELEIAKASLTNESNNNPLVENYDKSIDELNRIIHSFENIDSNTLGNYVTSFDLLNEIGKEYLEITLLIDLNNKLLEFLYPQYEAAKLQELKDFPIIEVIDDPVLPGFRAKPKRAHICIAAFLGGLFFSIFITLVLSAISNEQKAKMKRAVLILINSKKYAG